MKIFQHTMLNYNIDMLTNTSVTSQNVRVDITCTGFLAFPRSRYPYITSLCDFI